MKRNHLPVPATDRRQRRWTFRDGLEGTYLSHSPARLAEAELTIDSATAAEADRATIALAGLGPQQASQLGLLEAIASSRIEGVHAGVRDVMLARLGRPATTSTLLVRGAHDAVLHLAAEGPNQESVAQAHRLLLAGDPRWQGRSGAYRTSTVWIGGPFSSPPTAAYVPPEAAQVAEAMDDLFAFCARRDVPALVRAALAHAQFEAIHPYPDGNGRVGRALVGGVLSEAGLRAASLVPLSMTLAHDRERYVGALRAFRDGQGGPIVELYADAAADAATLADVWRLRLDQIRERDALALSSVARGDAGAWRVMELLHDDSPMVDAPGLHRRLSMTDNAVHRALACLDRAGIVRLSPRTTGSRNRVWEHAAALDLLEDLTAGALR